MCAASLRGPYDEEAGALISSTGPVSQAIVQVARLHRILTAQLLRRVGLHPSQELVMLQCGATDRSARPTWPRLSARIPRR